MTDWPDWADYERDPDEDNAAPREESDPLPPAPWHTRTAGTILGGRLVAPPMLCEALDIGPGRPCGIVGAPGSGKSDAVQGLALAVASGTQLWGRWDVQQVRVLHITYDMGYAACALRYRRLANGHGITDLDDDALVLDVHPKVYLTTPNAAKLLAARFAGFGLVILDNLRAAAPDRDENDSAFGGLVDLYGRACASVGATALYLHHSGKSGAGSRGTGAIIGSSGCIWQVETADTAAPRKLTQLRMSDTADAPRAPFWLGRTNVQVDDGWDVGGRPSWRYEATDEQPAGEPPPDPRRDRVLAAVRAQPGLTADALWKATRIKPDAGRQAIATLVRAGLVEDRRDRGHHYFPGTAGHKPAETRGTPGSDAENTGDGE